MKNNRFDRSIRGIAEAEAVKFLEESRIHLLSEFEDVLFCHNCGGYIDGKDGEEEKGAFCCPECEFAYFLRTR